MFCWATQASTSPAAAAPRSAAAGGRRRSASDRKGMPAFHQATAIPAISSVQLTQQVEEIPAAPLRAACRRRRCGAHGRPCRRGPCEFSCRGVPEPDLLAAAIGFAAPTQPLVPLERKHMRRILPTLLRGALPTASPVVPGGPPHLLPTSRASFNWRVNDSAGLGEETKSPILCSTPRILGAKGVAPLRRRGPASRQGCTVSPVPPKTGAKRTLASKGSDRLCRWARNSHRIFHSFAAMRAP